MNDVIMNTPPQHMPDDQHRDGFTLIELIIVVAIIGVMVSVAVPTIQAFVDRSRIARVLGSSRMIQGALATYSMVGDGEGYPEHIAGYDELVELVNEYGSSLKHTGAEMGFEFRSYTGLDTDGDGVYETYTMSLEVLRVPKSRPGWCVVVEPSGVDRCLAE